MLSILGLVYKDNLDRVLAEGSQIKGSVAETLQKALKEGSSEPRKRRNFDLEERPLLERPNDFKLIEPPAKQQKIDIKKRIST